MGRPLAFYPCLEGRSGLSVLPRESPVSLRLLLRHQRDETAQAVRALATDAPSACLRWMKGETTQAEGPGLQQIVHRVDGPDRLQQPCSSASRCPQGGAFPVAGIAGSDGAVSLQVHLIFVAGEIPSLPLALGVGWARVVAAMWSSHGTTRP